MRLHRVDAVALTDVLAVAKLEPRGRLFKRCEVALGDTGIDRIAHVLFANLCGGRAERVPDLFGEFPGLDACGLKTGQGGAVSARVRERLSL